MMRFEKVSLDQWRKDYIWRYNPYMVDDIYEKITLPKRATKGSAGYDFFAFESFTLQANSEILVPTGIRWICEDEGNKVLQIYPRSGLGFKHGMKLKNTTGIVDMDYSHSDNEGHIFVKLVNPSNHDITIAANQAYAQGVIVEFFTCDDDGVDKDRQGGFGSTDGSSNN